MVIYMHEHKPIPERGMNSGTYYGDEIMNSNWNPAVVYLVNDGTQRVNSPDMPDDLSTVDADEFLSRIYALATQI